MTIKVLIVDDSALVRKVLTEIINQASDLEVVGAAPDPLVARDMIKALNPDVLTLDVEMPRMDGIDFLEKLMRLRPMPVLMISTLTEKGSEVTLRALELGAIDYISKPKLDITRGIQEYAQEIVDKIRIAAVARVRRLPPLESAAPAPKTLPSLGIGSTEKVICIGASTGGTEAIKDFLVQMPPDSPGIVITQHMPEAFTKSFAERLDRTCPKLSVSEASDGNRVLPGHVYVAPGHSHLLLMREGANFVTRLNQEAPVSRHRPSVDVLFQSAAKSAGKNAVGVIMTGMGKDGAAGMAEMKAAGAYNFAQDEASCVVFGMPREAIAYGGVDEVAPLGNLPALVLKYLKAQGHGTLRV